MNIGTSKGMKVGYGDDLCVWTGERNKATEESDIGLVMMDMKLSGYV